MYTYRLTGNTYENLTAIRAMRGWRWDSNRKAWWCKSNERLNHDNKQLQQLVANGVIITEHSPNGNICKLQAPLTPRNDLSFVPGEQIEIKAWVAKQIAKQENLDLCFRNLELTEVYAELAKAVQCKVKFVSKVANSCHLCGRELDTELSRATGIGPVCAKKLKLDRGTYQDAQLTLKFLDEYAEKIGEVGPVWIPKSQMI